jgi:SAM-dependent methyltransferase
VVSAAIVVQLIVLNQGIAWQNMMIKDLPEICRQELVALFDHKYRGSGALGPDPARRLRWGYFTPDDHYEALVRRLVKAGSSWLDVGCGRDLFPSNRALARELSGRCAVLVGVDPDATIHENPFVHIKVQGLVQDLDPASRFDLVTMRMVAEHVADPPRLLDALARIVRPGGLVVIYTINRWSPVPLVTAVTPFSWHHPIKRLLWRTEAKDTFPTTYKMNTHQELTRLLDASGFEEAGFWYLDDCRSLQRFRFFNVMEIGLWSLLRRMGWRYPENCLLAVYRRRS